MKILFVCMGNICRSPTAEGVFRKLVGERAPESGIEIDSAGTHGYHVGNPPDSRAQSAASARGIDITALRARRISAEDFERFDLVLAMDRENLARLRSMAGRAYVDRVRLLLDFATRSTVKDVPDPYYGGATGFERVLDLVEDAAEGLLEEVLRRTRAQPPA